MAALLGAVRRVKVPREQNATAGLRQVESLQQWAASLKKSGFRVVPIVYADDSHNPVGLRKLRLLARNPQPFIDALVAGVKVRGGRPAIPYRYFLSPRGG